MKHPRATGASTAVGASQVSPVSIAVVGTGVIGQSWAVAFARAGHPVRLFDTDTDAADRAMATITATCVKLGQNALLHGQAPADVSDRVALADTLAMVLEGVAHVQENAPESLDVKHALFQQLDRLAPSDAVIASSSSALLTSQFTTGLAGASRCLVAHPLNPPHLIPAVEVMPGPQTTPEIVTRTLALMTGIGQKPIQVAREVEGFVMNRLQGALLDEAFALVADGVASVEDVDSAVRYGLARRWFFMGPFETIDLNAPGGIANFIDHYGPAYAKIGKHRPNRPVWSGALRELVVTARRARLPLSEIRARCDWRDQRLMSLATLPINSDGC